MNNAQIWYILAVSPIMMIFLLTCIVATFRAITRDDCEECCEGETK